MLCDEFLDRYDRLDAGAEPSPVLRRHLDGCPRCATLVAREAAALAAARLDAAYLPRRAAGLEGRIMAAVRLEPHPSREMSLGRWLVPGGLLVLAAALVPVGDDFRWLREAFGFGWEMPIALILGSGFAAYGALFIGSHMEELGHMVKR